MRKGIYTVRGRDKRGLMCSATATGMTQLIKELQQCEAEEYNDITITNVKDHLGFPLFIEV